MMRCDLCIHVHNYVGLCRQQQKKLIEAVEKARDHGMLCVHMSNNITILMLLVVQMYSVHKKATYMYMCNTDMLYSVSPGVVVHNDYVSLQIGTMNILSPPPLPTHTQFLCRHPTIFCPKETT